MPITQTSNCQSRSYVTFTCIPGHAVVGFAMYYFTYDPWIGKLLYLEDFYVMEEYRGELPVPATFFVQPGAFVHSLSCLYPPYQVLESAQRS